MSAAPDPGATALPADVEEPPVLPLPSPEVRHLSRWEGILGWAVGWLAGMIIAAAAIVALVVR